MKQTICTNVRQLYIYTMCTNSLLSVYLFFSHNDLADQLRTVFRNQLDKIDLTKNTSGQYGVLWQTDIPRLQAGQVGAQVGEEWSYAWHMRVIPCQVNTAQTMRVSDFDETWYTGSV